MISLTNKMESINEIVIDFTSYNYNIEDINALPNNTTHIRINVTDYTDPILNLPSSLKYFCRDYDNTGHCFEGFGELNQIDNFPHGLEVLILHIDKYKSFLNLPSSLEFIAILHGYMSDKELNLSRFGKIIPIKPIIIIPFNVKTFITTEFINDLYEIKMENQETKLIMCEKKNKISIKCPLQLINSNLPEKYRDYHSKNTLIKPNH
jgi:hypothetical protein